MRARVLASTLVLGLAAAGASAGPANAARSCAAIKNPYAGTRDEGADLNGIRATGVSCTTARKVVRGAHRKALGMTPTGPVRRYTWNGWKVTGDLRGNRDSYMARKGGKVVRWRF